jgi:hypothetical protein
VLLEFVLALPFLAGLISAIFFFGWAMRSQQQARIAARHGTWARLDGDRIPGEMDLAGACFTSEGTGVEDAYVWTSGEAEETFLSFAGRQGDRAAALLEACLGPPIFEPDLLGRFACRVPPASEGWRWVDGGPIRTSFRRAGRTWDRAHAGLEPAWMETYLAALDAEYAAAAPGAPQLTDTLRSLYARRW